MEDDPAYDLSVACLTGEVTGWEAGLVRAVEATLARYRRASARIHVVLVDDAHIAELHQRHLGKPGPTDVLAFDLRDRFDNAGADDDVIDAEIVVSVETAEREARSRGHSVEAELALYAVHATLHLLGYDDPDDEAAERMHRAEDVILESVGFGAVYRADAS